MEKEFFSSWQVDNKYLGKQFSILGDSISTLEGYNPSGYKVFYCGDNCVKSGVTQMSDTWWDKVISFFGGELLVNNSWSGSKVTKLPGREQLFPSGCSDERTSLLHINDVKPDVILVYLGTNDWAFGAKTGNEICLLGEDENECFDYAYDTMLKKLRKNYAQSDIWCCTLCETYMAKRPSFKFPHKHAGTHIEEYNDIIRHVVQENKCKLIDLYNFKMPYDSIDGSHPSVDGMNTLAMMMIRAIAGLEVNSFMDCDNNNHEFVTAEEYAATDDNVPTNDSEYILLDPDITTILFPNILRLTIESTGKTVQFQKEKVSVGRDISCDLLLEAKKTVARHQATFFYENELWFLRDDFSTNGTWLNGARMQAGKKYQLAANDEINFAKSEKVIFYKSEQTAQPAGDADAKAIAFLEAGMATFARSQQTDEVALKLIIAALSDAPLYFPVEIDIEAMLGPVDPTKLKPGDTLQTQQNVKMRILTLKLESGLEFVPMFTSNDEIEKGQSVSVIRYYPQDYLPMLIQMDKPVVINPFSDFRFFLNKQTITEIILPCVQSKTNTSAPVHMEEKQDKYLGKIVGERYEALKVIGRGGFYTTYLVRDVKNEKTWAMKACDKTNRNYNPVIRTCIVQEHYMMMKFNHHAIPRIMDIIEDDENLFIIKEYAEGVSLESMVRDFGPQPADRVVEWGKQLCDMLGYLHKLTPPHIHRDMKPGNIICSSDMHLMVVDFGTTRVYDSKKEVDTNILGTKGYAAPEQYGGCRQSDARTDIFGLGMTLHHLVTGVDPKLPPYTSKPICQINPNLPKGLEYIISKCTQSNPDDRYQSCDELMADLNNYMNLPKPRGIMGKLFGKK